MAEYTPHSNLFSISERISKFSNFIFWAILLLTIAPLAFKGFCETKGLIDIINILNIIGISIFFILEIISEFFTLPLANSKRRDDFIDNSLGSSFSTQNSVEYYDNEEVNTGLYKAAVNLFENCFFSYALLKSVTISRIIIPLFMFIVIGVITYYGMKEVPFGLSVLQAFFSANTLGMLIKHLILINRLSAIQDGWVNLFQHEDLKNSIANYQPVIFRYWLQYETLISKLNAGVSSRVFRKHNDSLTAEWNAIKVRYKIS